MPTLFPKALLAFALLWPVTFLAAHDEGSDGPRREDHYHLFDWNYDFGAELLVSKAQGDMKTTLDDRTGLGVGAQWTHFRRDWWLGRTRMEWVIFPESAPVGAPGTRTRTTSYTLSWDQLVFFNSEPVGPYALLGLGGLRWLSTETPTRSLAGGALPPPPTSTNATRLVATAGLGIRLANQVSLEGRYIVTSIHKNMDACTVQLCLGWYF